MDVVNLPTSELAGMASPYNPRQIAQHDLEALRCSLRYFGTVEPIVVNKRSGRIVGGHQRVKAAQAEGIEELPVVWVDLDDPSEKQLNLALNRITGRWDEEALAAVLGDLQAAGADLELTGFTPEELELLLPANSGLTDENAVPEPPETPATQPGDLVVLGNHRLLCGDAGDSEAVAQLVGSEEVHLLHTDPPYNVKVEPRSNNAIAANLNTKGNVPHHQKLDLERHPEKSKPRGRMRARDRALENDYLSDEDFAARLLEWFGRAAEVLLPGRSFYIWGGYANVANYPPALKAVEFYFSQTIIWHKQWPVLTRKDFMGDHEWCFYGWKKGAAHYFSKEHRNIPDVWSVKKISPQEMVHLTEKPVELAERALTYSSRRGENILDLFGGSGSTLIAAEKVNRHAFLMEIDPAYCDVIVQRWQDFTGKKAEGWRGNA